MPIAPRRGALFLSGRIIMTHAARFALRGTSGRVELFELARGSTLTARDLVELARGGALVTIEYRSPARARELPTAMRLFLGTP